MKLYLSSYFFGNSPEKLINLIEPGKKVAVIMNAGDVYGNEKRPAYLSKEVEKFQQFSLVAEELDLRAYFNGGSELAKKLDEYGAVWVMGGNSFILRRAMKYSGFDKLIVPLVQSDSIVYAGFSAGGVVASKTLKGIELVDDPQQIPPNYNEEIVWDGLGLVDFSFAPHYKSDHPESAAIDKVVAYFEENGMPFKAISDGQAIIVSGDQIEIADWFSIISVSQQKKSLPICHKLSLILPISDTPND